MTNKNLAEIKCFVLDMDGTVFLGEQLLPGAQAFLEYLNRRSTPFFFLTNNSSRSQPEYQEKLLRLGLDIPAEKIFTSGEATAIYLKKQQPGASLYVVGTPPLENEFRRFGFKLVDQDPDYAVLGFDTTLTYDKIWRLCDFVRAGLPFIATHPDINCPTETGFMPDIGAMIALIETSTGRGPDVIVGKPHPPVVEALVEKTGFPAAEICMVGDRLYTDIALGKAGFTTVLVLSGETKIEDVDGTAFKPDFIFDHLGALLADLAR